MAVEIGQVLGGRYQVESLIGQGGMGAVYRGVALHTRRQVAIKVLLPNEDPSSVERFRQEATAAGHIGNDHILDVIDIGENDGLHYMISEFLEGETLADRTAKRGRLTPEELVPITLQVLDGLAAAHRGGVVHRDLKPDNIFLLKYKAGRTDFVKIIDFGISKFVDQDMVQTRAGVVLGTPYYVSPEQAQANRVDHRADLYSLGVILYEAASGKLPFEAENMMQLSVKIVTGRPRPLAEIAAGIDPRLEEIIERAMARNPADRFQSAAEFAEALDRWRKVTPELFPSAGSVTEAITGATVAGSTVAGATAAGEVLDEHERASAPRLMDHTVAEPLDLEAIKNMPLTPAPAEKAPLEEGAPRDTSTPSAFESGSLENALPTPWWQGRRALLAAIGGLAVVGLIFWGAADSSDPDSGVSSSSPATVSESSTNESPTSSDSPSGNASAGESGLDQPSAPTVSPASPTDGEPSTELGADEVSGDDGESGAQQPGDPDGTNGTTAERPDTAGLEQDRESTGSAPIQWGAQPPSDRAVGSAPKPTPAVNPPRPPRVSSPPPKKPPASQSKEREWHYDTPSSKPVNGNKGAPSNRNWGY